jgi:DNA-binding transcriptional LysR family regulator
MQRRTKPRDDLRWDDVRLFLALCRARTVGDAGKQLGIDASTVSRRLVVLEDALSATLFDRGREGITPTKAAEDLLPVAEEIEDVMLRFTTAAEGLEREVSGVVRITCPPDVADVVVAPLIRELVKRHPALRIEIHPGETVLDLARREADLALRIVRPTSGDLVITRLTTARWVVAGSRELARELGTLRAWNAAPWVGWGKTLVDVGPARWFAKHVKGVEPIVRSDSLLVQLAVIATGAAIGFVPEPSVAHYRLVPIDVGPKLRAARAEWPVDELFLVTHRALRDVPRVRAVWSLLLERHGARH